MEITGAEIEAADLPNARRSASDTCWLEGARLFNAQEYWEAHEAWEPLWLEAEGLERHLYSSVILLAAALHKSRAMANPQGGRRNYAKALAHSALLPDHYRGVALRRLEAEVHAALQDPARTPQLPTTLEATHDKTHEDDTDT